MTYGFGLVQIIRKWLAVIDKRDKILASCLVLGALCLAVTELLLAFAVLFFLVNITGEFTNGQLDVIVSILARFTGIENSIRLASLLLGLVVIWRFVFSSIYHSILYHFVHNLARKTCLRLYDYYLRRHGSVDAKTVTPHLIRNLTLEMQNTFVSFVLPAFVVIQEVMVAVLISLAAFLFLTKGVLGGVAVLLMFLLLVIYVSRKRLRHYGAMIQQTNAEKIEVVKDGLSLKTEIITYDAFGQFNDKLYVQENHLFLNSYRAMSLTQFLRFFVEFIVLGSLAMAIFILSKGYAEIDALFQSIMFLAVALIRLLPSFNRVMQSVARIMQFLPSAQLILKDMNSAISYGRDFVASRHPLTDWQTFGFRDVNFSYKEQISQAKGIASADQKAPTIESLDFTFERGKFYMISGESGAGKSTILDLLLGISKPDSGLVFLKDESQEISHPDMAAHIALVPQQLYLFNGTLAENILMGRPETKEALQEIKDVLTALKMPEMADHLHQQVGEAGIQMSGGQKQRVILARALMRKADILILDEATSALDQQTEEAIISYLAQFKGALTLVAVTHKPQLHHIADYHIRVKNGQMEIQ